MASDGGAAGLPNNLLRAPQLREAPRRQEARHKAAAAAATSAAMAACGALHGADVRECDADALLAGLLARSRNPSAAGAAAGPAVGPGRGIMQH